MLVVCDTSPISNLVRIGRLDILKTVVGRITIPSSVAVELKKLQHYEIDTSFLEDDWVDILEPKDKDFILSLNLDPGEAEAIALAIELDADLLVIDERAGYKIATEYKLTSVGLIGILIKAKQLGMIESLKYIIEQLQDEAGFWLNRKFVERILLEYGE